MQTLSEREQNILEALVRQYVASAVPVSSKQLAEKSAYQLSSATIRTVMGDLTDLGYLAQPHTSAGRVPTQKGYRFFVNNCLEEHALSAEDLHRIRTLTNIRDVLRFISTEAHVCTITAHTDAGDPLLFGLGEILHAPEFQDPNTAHEFGMFIDALVDGMAAYRSHISHEAPHIFIAEENPLPQARSISVVATRYGPRQNLVLAVGPARMDYENVTALLKSIEHNIYYDAS